jgi:hypothetical protein
MEDNCNINVSGKTRKYTSGPETRPTQGIHRVGHEGTYMRTFYMRSITLNIIKVSSNLEVTLINNEVIPTNAKYLLNTTY